MTDWVRFDGKLFDSGEALWHLTGKVNIDNARQTKTLCKKEGYQKGWNPGGESSWDFMLKRRICYECVEALMT